MNLNQITLTGRLTKNPELAHTKTNQKSYSRFTLAVNRGVDKEGNERGANFIPCEVWGNRAENLVKYQRKGSKILLTGNLEVQRYKDQYGNNITRFFVLCNYIEYLGDLNKDGDSEMENPFKKEDTDEYEDFSDMDKYHAEFDLSDGGIGLQGNMYND